MLFRKYDIVVFKDNEGCCGKMRIRGWMGIMLFLLFIGLIGGNIYFWNYFTSHGQLETRLANSEKTVEDQKSQLLNLANKLTVLEEDLARIRDFDSKLQVMFGQETPLQGEAPTMGSGGSYEFRRSDLIPLRPQALTRALRQCQEDLDVQMRMEEVRQQQLMLAIRSQVTRLHLMPSIWPVRGILTSGFGYRRDPFTNAASFHPALDISAPKGTPVYSPASGRVVYADWDGAYGQCVHVRHTPTITTRYAHLSEIDVRLGQNLERGDLIGQVGSTGRATGAHLHYEVRINGDPVNPRNYILN